MPIRTAEAAWQGNLTEGSGTVKLGSGLFESPYSFTGRVEEGKSGTTPEELIAAALSACYTMALSADLGRAGFTPNNLHTTAKVQLRRDESGLKITGIQLVAEGDVPDIDEARFQEVADGTKSGCPVSVALASVPLTLEAKLIG